MYQVRPAQIQPNWPKKGLDRYRPNKFGLGWTRPAIWARPAQGQPKLGGGVIPSDAFHAEQIIVLRIRRKQGEQRRRRREECTQRGKLLVAWSWSWWRGTFCLYWCQILATDSTRKDLNRQLKVGIMGCQICYRKRVGRVGHFGTVPQVLWCQSAITYMVL